MTKISAVIPDELARVLEDRARLEDRSRGAVVRIALAEHLASPSDRGRPTDEPGPTAAAAGSTVQTEGGA